MNTTIEAVVKISEIELGLIKKSFRSINFLINILIKAININNLYKKIINFKNNLKSN